MNTREEMHMRKGVKKAMSQVKLPERLKHVNL